MMELKVSAASLKHADVQYVSSFFVVSAALSEACSSDALAIGALGTECDHSNFRARKKVKIQLKR